MASDEDTFEDNNSDLSSLDDKVYKYYIVHIYRFMHNNNIFHVTVNNVTDFVETAVCFIYQTV